MFIIILIFIWLGIGLISANSIEEKIGKIPTLQFLILICGGLFTVVLYFKEYC
jgi:hypothetical protein